MFDIVFGLIIDTIGMLAWLIPIYIVIRLIIRSFGRF